ncbi:SAM-dependent methyltransferase [Paenibacillus lentus]|uniref:Methyltransferase domain-containing protein n=1 Tax=Paenibacillus lentus TaxID=1338368 RepID=A0A3Q8S799_9BACL|nr:SAM-dependent methyltransferase [Paenibacillus lentus]AZK49077.1 methyltransferase domain-containing protein [Paenibacillus lentus]
MEQSKTGDKLDVVSHWICSTNHGFAPYAQEELRRMFGAVKSSVIIPGEVLRVTLQEEVGQVIDGLLSKTPIFLRHLFPIEWEWSVLEQGEFAEGIDALTAFVLSDPRLLNASKVAIQPRKSEQSLWNSTAAGLKELLQDKFCELNAEFVVRDAEYIVSVFVDKEKLYAGISRPEQNLSDWSGGAVRFQREEGQISRAKFKLLEAELTFGIDFTAFREALDIGAAPGGWTSFLLERGLKVTAIDPAKMHPSLKNHPQLTVIRKNAGEVKLREEQFDLLVCDMSWSPKLTAKLVSELLYSLLPGGTAIVTVKLLSKKPMALIQEVIETFHQSRMQVQRAKQLFHNRDEITLYMIKY